MESGAGGVIGMLAVTAVWLAAAAVVFVQFYSRVIVLISHARLKYWIVIGSFVACLAVAVSLRCLTLGTRWVALPAGILLLALIGELDRLRLRGRHAASAAVETDRVGIRLARPVTTFDLAFTRYEVPAGAWCGARLRVVHISDLHLHDRFPPAFYEAVVTRVNEAHPDVIFVTGDFVTAAKFAGMVPGVLSGMHAPLGKFGVLGNHDHWADAALLTQRVTEGGVRLLGNSVCALGLPGGGEVMLGGCEDPWGRPRWRATDAQGRPLFVLTHTADNIRKLAQTGAVAVFAGHYHAGQGRLPWIGSVLVPSRYGRLFDHGHFMVGETHLFVTAGVGCASPPVRIYCQPEITAIDFVPSSPAATG